MVEEESVRIYVGGIGESVSVDDLRKTLSSSPSLGTVTSVELVRTKGRSFAYINFSPSSPHSLPNLFSKYNGCAWKGGKLRLEKAKEHYLVRLRREWSEEEEDAQISTTLTGNHIDANKPMLPLPSEKPKKVLNLNQTQQLRIFIPKLNKVKLLPLSGSGKHKYSFQRIQVPSLLPIHFCDCKEHSPPVSSNNIEGTINEGELDMMNSVMHKLFNAKKATEPPKQQQEEEEEEDSPGKLMEDANDMSSSDNDEDNIVMNIVSKGKKRSRTAISFNQDEEVSGRFDDALQNPRDSFTESKLIAPPKRKISNPTTTENGSKECTLHKRATLLQSERFPEDHSKWSEPGSQVASTKEKEKGLVVASQTTEGEKIEKKSSKGASWLQKSSWTQLVNQTNASFSISHILPNSSNIETTEEILQPKWVEFGKSTDQNLEHKSSELHAEQPGTLEDYLDAVRVNNKAPEERSHPRPKKMVVGETCSFMRSSASEREWAKTKAALSGSLKKKGNDN